MVLVWNFAEKVMSSQGNTTDLLNSASQMFIKANDV